MNLGQWKTIKVFSIKNSNIFKRLSYIQSNFTVESSFCAKFNQ